MRRRAIDFRIIGGVFQRRIGNTGKACKQSSKDLVGRWVTVPHATDINTIVIDAHQASHNGTFRLRDKLKKSYYIEGVRDLITHVHDSSRCSACHLYQPPKNDRD